MMEIHIIRHGKTLANEKRLYCGQTDLPLSENGAKEIAQLKDRGIYPDSGAYFTSGLLRCEQTLDIIFGGVQREAVPGLAECRFGEFEMKSYEQLRERADYQAWINDETGNFECPGGESRKRFEKRVINAFKQIKEPAFVVCHGGAIATIMEYLFPKTKNFYEWQPGPGRGYTLSCVFGKGYEYKKI
jgi:alpha-ribazole phosphatase